MIAVRINYSPRLTPGEREILLMPNRLRNLRPLMKRSIAPAFNAMLKRHWDSKGAAFGHKWAPWAPATRAARLRKGNAAKGLMRDSDHLFKTLFQERLTDDRLKVINGGIRFQANVGVKYAIFHQRGTEHLPIRQVIPEPLPRSFTDDVREMVHEFVATGRTRFA